MAASQRERTGCGNPYAQLLSDSFLALPANLRTAHGVELVAEGAFDVWRPPSRLARWVGDRLGLPRAGKQVAVRDLLASMRPPAGQNALQPTGGF